MITVTVRENTVVFTADAEAQEILRDEPDYLSRVQLIREWLHEKWEQIDPSEIGALTDSEIFAKSDEMVYGGESDMLVSVGPVCWFPDYTVCDWTKQLEEKGETIFTLHK